MFGKKKPEVLVIGAGPVGLFTALSLARRGVTVQVVDKEWRTAAHAYALALHGDSLSLLKDVGLLDAVREQAYPVHTLNLYEAKDRRATLHPLNVAVMRQDLLEGLLEDALRQHGVRVLWNHQMASLAQDDDHVVVDVDKLVKGSTGYAIAQTEWVIAKTKTFEPTFVVGADGHSSYVREALGIDYPSLGGPFHFAVFEFRTDADLNHEMSVMMDDHTTNVLWPLPDGKARWSFQLENFEAHMAERQKDRFEIQIGGSRFPVLDEAHLHTFIAERAPWFTGSIDEIDWRLVVQFEQRLATSFGQGHVWLAGDAGHMTGPVGIQSMNVGLREAHDLAKTLTDILHHGRSMDNLEHYNNRRQAEWCYLLGLEGGLKPGPMTDPWVREHAHRLLPCIPASGETLNELAHQLDLHSSEFSTQA